MKTILVLMDSLNRHFLKVYNPDATTLTPAIDSFARECVVFDNHFIGSAPCMPARRDIFTGRTNFLDRCWGGIEPFDVTLPQTLRGAGVYTHITTDHTHYLEIGGENYLDQFDTWDYQRGQEMDKWVSCVTPAPEPEHLGRWNAQYGRNKRRFQTDADYPSPKTFASACDWAEANRGADDFFLMVEAFDPHEPFDCPKEYLNLYEPDYDGPLFDWPHYAAVTETDDQIAHLRNAYRATLTMADRWFGKFIEALQKNGLYDDALIVLTTDHGHLLGEHGFTGKNFTHCYNELAHIPMLVRHPGGAGAGRRESALTQNIDLMPTILAHHGVATPDRVKGRSLLATQGGAYDGPDALIYGWHGQTVNVYDGRYTYFRAPNEANEPCYNYCGIPSTLWRYFSPDIAQSIETGRFLRHTNYPVYRVPGNLSGFSGHGGRYYRDDQLFDLHEDHAQLCPLDDPETERAMLDKLRAQLAFHDAPDDQYQRLRLR